MNRKYLLLIAALLAVRLITANAAQPPEADPPFARAFKDAKLQWGPCPAFMPKGCEIAALHGDPAKPNADIFFKVPGNVSIPRHWHTSAERMVLVSGRLEVTYDGRGPVVLKPGTYAYGPAKAPHKAFCAKGAPCVLFIAFEAPVDALPAQDAK